MQLTALTLDIHLPDIDGWRILQRLKSDMDTRHIPVCVISTDESRERALESGCRSFVPKPLQSISELELALQELFQYTERESRDIVIIDPDPRRQELISRSLEAPEGSIHLALDVEQAAQWMNKRKPDCVIVGSVTDLHQARSLKKHLSSTDTAHAIPVFVFAEAGASADNWCRELGPGIVVRCVHSTDRLLDQTALFLHRDTSRMSESSRRAIDSLHSSDEVLAGKQVLIVDDDIRNIFALTTVLEEHEMLIESADNGRSAIQLLRDKPTIDIVLMDIMMPEMDGIDTMREIRRLPIFNNLPIVAVTAKAMKGDREKCIEAGAWDYLAKPVDTDQLLAVLRAWLHR